MTPTLAGSLWVGFIAAQIAVALPLLMVGQWVVQAMPNYFAYTHPVDFESWETVFNPFGTVEMPLAYHWLFRTQLIFAWFAAFIWHQREANLKKRKHHWTLTGILALVAFFPGIYFTAASADGLTYQDAANDIANGMLFLCFFGICCHFQSWLTLLYAYQRLRGVERPGALPIVLLSVLASLPLAAYLWLASSYQPYSLPAQTERVLHAGSSVNIRTQNGDTMLHFAASEGEVAAVTFLLRKGAEVNAVNSEKDTPFSICLRYGRPRQGKCEYPGYLGMNTAACRRAQPVVRHRFPAA